MKKLNIILRILVFLFILIFPSLITAQIIPKTFSSKEVLRDFIEQQPQFKSRTTGVVVTLGYDSIKGFSMYADGSNIGQFYSDLNLRYPTRAILVVPFMVGWQAPFVLDVADGEPFLALLPVEGQETIWQDNRGKIHTEGRPWMKNWNSLDIDKHGIYFQPVNAQPPQKNFDFIGFNKEKFTPPPPKNQIDPELQGIDDYVTVDGIKYVLNKKSKTASVYKANFQNENKIVILPEYIIVSNISFKVTSIGEGAFKNNIFKSIVIPPGYLTLGEDAFSQCESLKEVTLSVKEIPKNAFYGCKNLQTVILLSPDFDSFGWNSFMGCKNLRNVYLYTSQPPSCPYSFHTESQTGMRSIEALFSEVFYCTYEENSGKDHADFNVTIHIPKGKKDVYNEKLPWKYFKLKDDIYRQGKTKTQSKKLIKLGLEFLNFAIGKADKAGDSYLNLDLGLNFRYGEWNDRFQAGIGLRAGIGMISPYEYDDLDITKEVGFQGKFYMPLNIQGKIIICKISENINLFSDAKLIFNIIKDKDFQRNMAWSAGLGLGWKNWEWNLYYKREFGKYNGKYCDFKEYIPFAIGTTVAYYFNLY